MKPSRASLPLMLAAALLASSVHAEIFLAQGIMSGEPTATTILLQTRLTAISGPTLDPDGDVPGAAGVARFDYATKPDFSDAQRTPWLQAVAAHDFIVRAHLTQLRPGQHYYFRPVFGADEAHTQRGHTGSFSTLPGRDSDRALSFIVGSCMNYMKFMHGKRGKAGPAITATEEDKRLGYRVFEAMPPLEPAFFVGTGDTVYYDNILHGPAKTVPELRKCWHEQFRFPRLVAFFDHVPAYWAKDDHDFRFNESDNETDRLPLPQTGISLLREQAPIVPAGDETSPTYRTQRVNRHVQIWITEGRDYRSANNAPDGPEKSLWGREQRAWLMRTLEESDATWKILISPTPMIGPDDAAKNDNHSDLGGFHHEGEEFFAWVVQNKIPGFMIFCGDRHWQYHSIHPTGIEEFACGAMNDENSRLGVPPGSPKGSDPEGRIKQPFLYSEPTGGFLNVRVDSAGKLVIEHRDDYGKILNSVTKLPK